MDLTMTGLEEFSISSAGSITGINEFKADSASLNLNGAGEIRLHIEADQLNSSLSGAGNIVLSGKVSTHQIGHSGAGNLQANPIIRSLGYRYDKFLSTWKDADPDLPEIEDTGKRPAGLT